MDRNVAGDFVAQPGYGLTTEMLRHYCEWVGIDDKAWLHDILINYYKADLRKMRYWNEGAIVEGLLYMNIAWNFDGAPNLEELFRRDLKVFCSYAPFTEFCDDTGRWQPYKNYLNRTC